MYQPSSVPPTEHTFPNGTITPPSIEAGNTTAIASDSDSDLSEAIDIPNGPTPYINGEGRVEDDDDDDHMSNAESSHEEDAMGSDDPDYDMATPPAQNGASIRDTRSSSQESPQQRKRKTGGTEHEEFMLNDPELYGLRRSVSF